MKTALIILGFVILVLILGRIVNRKRADKYYAEQMIYLRHAIHKKPVTKQNFDYLLTKFEELAVYKTEDPFRKKLFVDFSDRFRSEWEKTL